MKNFASPRCLLGFPGGAVVEKSPVNAGDTVRSLGQEDPLEKEMATHSNNFAWRIPWTDEPGGLQSMGSQRVGCNWAEELEAAEHAHMQKIQNFIYVTLENFIDVTLESSYVQ